MANANGAVLITPNEETAPTFEELSPEEQAEVIRVAQEHGEDEATSPNVPPTAPNCRVAFTVVVTDDDSVAVIQDLPASVHPRQSLSTTAVYGAAAILQKDMMVEEQAHRTVTAFSQMGAAMQEQQQNAQVLATLKNAGFKS